MKRQIVLQSYDTFLVFANERYTTQHAFSHPRRKTTDVFDTDDVCRASGRPFLKGNQGPGSSALCHLRNPKLARVANERAREEEPREWNDGTEQEVSCRKR